MKLAEGRLAARVGLRYTSTTPGSSRSGAQLAVEYHRSASAVPKSRMRAIPRSLTARDRKVTEWVFDPTNTQSLEPYRSLSPDRDRDRT